MAGRIDVSLVAALALIAGCGSWADNLFCESEGCDWDPGAWQRLSTLANVPPTPPDPTNQWADDPAAAALGKKLYFDDSFSGPSRQMDSLRRPTTDARAPAGQPIKISCATCHDIRHGGVDVSSVPGNVSVGAGLTDVNALPTLNAAQRRTVFWNGRLDSLWGLNLVVGESDTTLNGTRLQTAHVLAERYADEVQALFWSVLPPDWRERARGLPAAGKPGAGAYDGLSSSDQALATTLLVVWAKAIAAYERTLVSRDSDFDRFVADGPRSTHLSASAKRGARLFVGRAGCIDCHSGPLLADELFHNVGVPQAGPAVPLVSDCANGSFCDCTGDGKNCLPWGAYNSLLWMRDTGPKWFPIIDAWNDDPFALPRAAQATPFDPALRGAWRTPSLRDVALTAPYMHDGVYQSIEDVLWHYNNGGRAEAATAVGTPSAQLKPLGLTAGEVGDLAEFLKTLTGTAPTAGTVDASAGGLDAGTDAGTEAGTGGDAGTDAGSGTDAGTDTGAGGDAGTDTGAGGAGGCAPAGACAVPAPVQDIFARNCTRCHPPQSGLSLASPVASYSTLVGVAVTGAGCTDRVRVAPGDAGRSYLVAKLRNTSPICGARMPFGAAMLAEAQIQTIEAWINGLRP